MQSISGFFGFYFCIYPESNPLTPHPHLSVWSSLIFVTCLLDCGSNLSPACLLPFKLLYGLSSTQQSEWMCSNEPDLVTALLKLLHSYQSQSQSPNLWTPRPYTIWFSSLSGLMFYHFPPCTLLPSHPGLWTFPTMLSTLTISGS